MTENSSPPAPTPIRLNTSQNHTMDLILASSSPYRRHLLARLDVPFQVIVPDVDETPLPDETAFQLTRRLAIAKAQAVAKQVSQGVIIASDQVAVLDGQIIGKPGNHDQAVVQLLRASGRAVLFINGLCVLNCITGNMQTEQVLFTVHFRTLSRARIERYLLKEQPYHSAGSFKSEQLGVILLERLEGDDPTALIGLPLIRLVHLLENEGFVF